MVFHKPEAKTAFLPQVFSRYPFFLYISAFLFFFALYSPIMQKGPLLRDPFCFLGAFFYSPVLCD